MRTVRCQPWHAGVHGVGPGYTEQVAMEASRVPEHVLAAEGPVGIGQHRQGPVFLREALCLDSRGQWAAEGHLGRT